MWFMYQGPISHFFANTTEDFFMKTLNVLREATDFCYDKLEGIPCITCPHKAEGSMFVIVSMWKNCKRIQIFKLKTLTSSVTALLQVKLNLSLLEGINDDMEFCVKLAKEESMIVLHQICERF
ncbi:Nicotianamine aminotransferase 1 [Camellia lanceoleosa]|uniref:Nicotianamine aminotransferase 1 n=1 Tax=Camellia lanceoleosa TaxID=1840588 RepID=A0ACC0J5Z6_9ERIC|nr:Nicotianamine aminotransferase 1 [Camellia lanceoleosa]